MMVDEAGTSRAGASTIVKDPEKDYEVFINFRGTESGCSVVDILYHALRQAEVGVFYADESIRKGDVIEEELKNGINKSKIYIPIFSKDYASSKWCLRELRQIIERWEEARMGKTIIPIFYHVDVSIDLKLKPETTSLYKDAMEKNLKDYRSEHEGWCCSLRKAAGISGWDLRKEGLTKVKERIVEDVCRKLWVQPDPEKALDDYVGIPEQMDKIMELLKLGKPNDRFRIVGIYGLGGMGKTTLARFVYGHLKRSSHFPDGAAFLSFSDGKPHDVVNLEDDLISLLLKADRSAVPFAGERTKQKLKKKVVLIVLDSLENGHWLLEQDGETSLFNTKSRVIITTRNKGIMTLEGGRCEEYEMPKIEKSDAMVFICKQCFKSNWPSQEIEDKVRKAVERASGYPVAICDIVSDIRRNNKDELSPLDKVNEILMESYNQLKVVQREIFLDVACLFIGKERDDASYYWKAQDHSPGYVISVLLNFSLIKIVDGDKLSMDRPVRELGRNIVNDEEIYNPRKRSRLWSPKVAQEVVSGGKGTEKVLALNLGKLDAQHVFNYKQFQGFNNLRFLELSGGEFNGGEFNTNDFERVFSELRWLCWDKCPPESTAINCCFRNLVVLMLWEIQIKDYSGVWDQLQAAEGLKVLKCINFCPLEKWPIFSAFRQLEILVFKNCPGLLEIDQSFEDPLMANLKVLKCIDCPLLGKLPKFSAFPQLEILVFENCAGLVEIDLSIGDLAKLKHLCLSCANLKGLPESVGNLRSLIELDLSHTTFTTLPEHVSNLEGTLKVFKCEGCRFEIPDELKSLMPSNP